VLLRAAEERARAPRPGDGRRHVQGVRPAGQQHARGDPDDARVPRRDRVPAQRPGDPSAPAAQCSARVRRRVSGSQTREAGPRLGRVVAMATLPADFSDLEPFADWAIPTERARYAKRIASSMAELQAFYDATFPRLAAGTDYLKSVPLDGIGEQDTRLLWLFCSVVTVSFPVEVW